MPNGSCPVPDRQRTALLIVAGMLVSQTVWALQSGLDVTVRGTILTTGFRNSGRVNNADVPTIALQGDGSALGGTVRQTRIGITATHESVLGGRLFAEIDADFFGGQQPSGGGRTHPLLRVRRAFTELRWPNVTLLVGQESPSVFAVSPRSVVSSGFPQLASAGNLWLWLPQIRVTALSGSAERGKARLGLEASLLAPNAGEAADPFLTQPDRAEQSGRPNFEGRAVVRWGTGGREGEIGVGGHLGWVGPDTARLASRAVGLSAIIPLGRFVEVRGEAFTGRALAGLGGGGIGQNIIAGRAVRTTGGWGQVAFLVDTEVEIAVSTGVDNPDDADLVASGRLRNHVTAANLTWRRPPVLASLEARRLATDFQNAAGRGLATHLALGVGIEF